ncbi:hypothetical protein B0H11DRAFT_2199133 [Mycena galericulata]|nr:hypothetical protein B0H11DRAFT_2199133 [Mycena galericulata]
MAPQFSRVSLLSLLVPTPSGARDTRALSSISPTPSPMESSKAILPTIPALRSGLSRLRARAMGNWSPGKPSRSGHSSTTEITFMEAPSSGTTRFLPRGRSTCSALPPGPLVSTVRTWFGLLPAVHRKPRSCSRTPTEIPTKSGPSRLPINWLRIGSETGDCIVLFYI